MSARYAMNAEPLPGYRLLERLGAGGFGEVWKTEAPGGLHKAIKLVHGIIDELDGDATALQELKALQRVKNLHHPFILSLERVDIVDGQLVIVMELAECNLMQRLDECRAQGLPGIPRDELLRYMEETAEALDLMNREYQVQHLDIKPQNLFLIRKHIKVADFGLAKDLEGTHAALSSGITPTYAAPETFEGRVSHYCDQYSLAIVYQELLTGQRPFNGKNPRHLLMQHVAMPPDLAPLPEADRAIVGRALAKNPVERFPRCLDFVRALPRKAALPGGVSTARSEPASPDATVRVPFPAPTHPTTGDTPAAAAGETPFLAPPEPADDLPRPRKRSSQRTIVPPPSQDPPWRCPRCGTVAKATSPALGLCRSCGYCPSIDERPAPPTVRQSLADLPTWVWVLLTGTFLIVGSAIVGNSWVPVNSEARAIWGVGQMVAGLVLVLGAQIAAAILLAAKEEGLGVKDLFLISGRLWARVVEHLPTTRWPVYLLTWGLFLGACGLSVGDLTYWARYHAPRKQADDLRRSIAALEENDPTTEERRTVSRLSEYRPPAQSPPAAVGPNRPPAVQCVVVGYLPSEDGSSFTGVLTATVRDGKLVQTDVVERGFTPKERDELYRRLQRVERPTPPAWWKGDTPSGVVWVRADSRESVVCEVECARVDAKSGKPVKPRYRGLASDGPAE
jgi:serine/threonine protein kinase